MRLSRRSILALALAVLVAGAWSPPLLRERPRRKAPKKIENTDPALRLKAFADTMSR